MINLIKTEMQAAIDNAVSQLNSADSAATKLLEDETIALSTNERKTIKNSLKDIHRIEKEIVAKIKLLK